MTLKTFNFTYEFKDLDTAMVAGHALLGYMTGTYCQPAISLSLNVFVTVSKTITSNQ